MAAPGFSVTVGDRGASSPAADDVGGLFAVGLTDRGLVGTPVDVRSTSAFTAQYGDNVAYSQLRQVIEAYFREGGTRAVISRVVGPAAVNASLVVAGSGGTLWTISAISPGAWANGATGGLSFTVLTGAGSTRTIILELNNQVVLSGVYVDEQTPLDALTATGLVTVAQGAGAWPATAAAEANLAGGTDDRGSIVDTQWQNALNTFDADLGAGSVAAPGNTTPTVHAMLFDHAQSHNRFALCDAIDTPTAVTLTTAAGVLRTATGATSTVAGDAPYGMVLAPWEKVPTVGSGTLTLPPSGSMAGRMARVDRSSKPGPGQPAAGRVAASNYSVDVSQTFTEADRALLNDAGIVVIRNIARDGGVQAYGYRTLADPAIWPQYVEANGMRVLMAIHSEGLRVLAGYVLRTIDGRGHLLSELEKDLVGVADGWYGRDALYGATSADAFKVDVGPGVNPPAQLAARTIAAILLLKTSPFAERVELTITKLASGDTI